MVPGTIVELSDLPLTINGKVDKKALPNPFEALQDIQDNEKAQNKLQEDLIEVWKQLLAVDAVGINSNFFELGGDSIITIQLVRRLKQLNYHALPKDVFENPTIAGLSKVINEKAVEILAEQGSLTGDALLLPIQQWFLEKENSEISHFNQALLLEIDKNITADSLTQAVEALVQQHDALRFKYSKEENTWRQSYTDVEGALDLEDLSAVDQKELATAITTVCEKYQASLNIEEGQLFKAVLIKTSDDRNRLFLTIHHLAVDGVSWRIILDHLNQAIAALENGEAIDLGLKTSDYRAWGATLSDLAEHKKITDQKQYWESVLNNTPTLPVDYSTATGSQMKDVKECIVSLDSKRTHYLLKEVNQSYNTRIDDILLWFTNLYPVSLDLSGNLQAGNLIKSVKEQLRLVPEKGLGFGLLRYLHPSEKMRADLSSSKLEVIFNYLGQIDNNFEKDARFKLANESVGKCKGDLCPFDTKLEINSSIKNGELQLSWTYSDQQYKSETIEGLAATYITKISELIEHCLTIKETEYTPSDYNLAPQVSPQDLDSFLNKTKNGQLNKDRLSALYPLSPMQEGILFHALYDNKSNAFTEQFTFDFPEGLNVKAFQSAWESILDNHSILRTSFLFDDFNIPVQCVHKKVTLPFEVLNYSTLSKTEKANNLSAFLEADYERGFQFDEAPLMRITLLKMDDKAYKMVWTHQHILLDGWSTMVLLRELLSAYEAILNGGIPAKIEEDKFENYIKHLCAQDKYKEEAYWKAYMSGLETPSLLPFVPNVQHRNKAKGLAKELSLNFDKQMTARIENFAKSNEITVNTIIQEVSWSVFLLFKMVIRKPENFKIHHLIIFKTG